MTTLRKRLIKIADYKGLSVRAFEDYCGLKRGNISNMADTGNIGSDKLSKIFDALPEISPQWLLTGRGEMVGSTSTNECNIDDSQIKTLPRIPLDASAGALSIISNSVRECDCERLPRISRFPKYDFTILIKGDSMEPEFHSGDEVACRIIDQAAFIQWGRPHILDTSQGIVLKRIFNRQESILCRSDNKFYEDFEIPKDEILHIALVVGIVRTY